MTHAIEIWLPVVGYEGLYEVSDAGRVRSLPRSKRVGRWKGQIVKPTRLSNGYFQVCLYRDGKSERKSLHVIVLEAFGGERPEGLMACHGPRGKSDNSASNLEWGTQSKNTGEDRLRDGTHVRGDKHGMAKFTWNEVSAMRRLASSGVSHTRLMQDFGISRSNLRRILRGESWVTPPEALPDSLAPSA